MGLSVRMWSICPAEPAPDVDPVPCLGHRHETRRAGRHRQLLGRAITHVSLGNVGLEDTAHRGIGLDGDDPAAAGQRARQLAGARADVDDRAGELTRDRAGWNGDPVANESRLSLVEGRRYRPLASCVSAIPLMWLAMFRSADLTSSRSARFTTSAESAMRRLDNPHNLRRMFAAYGDVSQHASMLAGTIAAHVSASRSDQSSLRVSFDVGEIAGEHPSPRVWARALGQALDALDGSVPEPAPTTPPDTEGAEMTEIAKIRRLRVGGGLGIGEARSRLRDHGGDLDAALEAIEAAKSHDQRARDRAGAFVAGLVIPQDLPDRPPWRVLLEASGLEHGTAFPPADVLLQSSAVGDGDVRPHARLLGEAVVVGTDNWEPAFSM